MTQARKYTALSAPSTTRGSLRVPIVTIDGRFSLVMLGAVLAATIVGCLPAKRVSGTQDETASSGSHSSRVQRALQVETLAPVRRQILLAAEDWLGTPYRYGGESRSGTDCSGFLLNVFAEVGIAMPRTSVAQSKEGTGVSPSDARPGDLYFFNTSGAGVSHVGIALLDGDFIHASTSKGVIVSNLKEGYYSSHFMFARRIVSSRN